MAYPKLTLTVSGDYELSTNWYSGVTPSTGDTVIVSSDATYNLTTNIDQAAGVALGGWIEETGCSIEFGTANNPLQLNFQSTADMILDGSGDKYIEIAGATTGGQSIIVRNCGTLHLASYGSYMLASDLNIETDSGTVYVAWNGDEVAKVDTIEKTGDADVYIGAGVTNSTGAGFVLETAAGTTYCHATTATAYIKGETEEVHFLGSAAVTNFEVHKGTMYHSAEGMCSTGNVYPAGKLSFEQNPNEGVAMASCVIHGSGEYQDPYNVIAIGAELTYDPSVATVHFGTNRKVTTGTV